MWFGEIYAGTAWPPHLDCLDLSSSMESVCVQIVHRWKFKLAMLCLHAVSSWLPMTPESRRWLNFQVVAWVGVLNDKSKQLETSRQSKVLSSSISLYYMLAIPGLATTKSWLVVACFCSQYLTFLIVTVTVRQSWKLQVLVPIQRGHQVWSRSFTQPQDTHDHPRVHCWLANKHRHSECTVCIQRWPATLSRHMHLFFVKNINICQPRQCRSNSNQDRTSPLHMSLNSECYVLVLAGNWASVTWSDGGEGHLKDSIRPNNPKAASQWYTESHMQWSVGVPSSKLTERVELHVWTAASTPFPVETAVSNGLVSWPRWSANHQRSRHETARVSRLPA